MKDESIQEIHVVVKAHLYCIVISCTFFVKSKISLDFKGVCHKL